jgi:flavin reductase (DIM6/NTAB) family NADH-FMN oxidoreductase RutF
MDGILQFEDAGALLKEAMRLTVGGVSVVTAGIGEERTGLTATSATSLSLSPPTMLVCVNKSASALPVIERRRHFCVNFIGADLQAVAERFSGMNGLKGAARYAGADWRILETGALALVGAVASIDCEVEELIERHSHVMVIGAVRAVTRRGGDPLVYTQGLYRALLD